MTKSSKATMAEASGQKLLDAAVHVIRAKGYSAARVEDIYAKAEDALRAAVLPSFRALRKPPRSPRRNTRRPEALA